VTTDPAAPTVEGFPRTLRDRIWIGRLAAVEEIRRRGGTAEFLQADFSSLRTVREG